MRVTVSVAGRFHAFHLVEQLFQRGHLQRFITSTLNADRLPNRRLPESIRTNADFLKRVIEIPLPEYLGYAIRKLPFPDSQALSFFIKDNQYDRKAATHIPNSDLFVGWAGQSLFQLREAKARGAKTIIERGSTHIAEQFRLIEEERKKFGVASPVRSRWERLIEEKQIKEYHETDYIMVPSEFARQSFLARGFAPDKILQVRYGVDLSLFSPPKEKVKSDIPTFLFVGAIGFQKGIPYLLEAIRLLRSKGYKFRFKLIGRFELDFKSWIDRSDLRSQIDEHIPFVSNSELASHFYNADALTLSSVQEGLALVIAEAMACGLPIIATENTGAREFIGTSDSGIIVRAGDQEALASAMQIFLNDREEAQRRGRLAAEQARTFEWATYGDEIEQAYLGIVARSKEIKSGDEEIASFYNEYWDREHGWTPTHSFTTQQLDLHFKNTFASGDSVLDVGCGDASNYQAWLVNQVRDLKALDISSLGIERAKQMGIDATQHDLSKTFPYSSNSFEGAVCIEVLEHLYDPKFTVSEIFRVLKPGGLLVASVPNNGYFRERLKAFTKAEMSTSISDFSNEWKGAHIRFYSLKSFTRMLDVCGFEIESVQSNGDGSIFDGLDAFGGYSMQHASSFLRRKLPRPMKLAMLENIWPSLFAPHIIVRARKPKEVRP